MTRVVCLIALLTSASLGPASADVSGEARFGEKPATDAVIWIDAPEARRPATQAQVVLDLRDMSFSPRVLVVRKGTMVTLPNNDRVFHDVFSDRDGKALALGLYPVGAVQQVKFDQAGLNRIFCHIHPQMAAYVLVVESSYFSIADANGRFTLPSVPLGEYRYHAWRPGGPTLESTVVVNTSTRLEVRWP